MVELLTRREVAGICKVSLRTVTRWLQKGNLPAVRLGRNVRIRRDDLERFIQAHRFAGR